MENEPKPFTREELQEIRERAIDESETQHLNPDWKRAYLRLADAADALDAMLARCQVQPSEPVEFNFCQHGVKGGRYSECPECPKVDPANLKKPMDF